MSASSSADVFAFPSTKEGFGLAAMEALAAGVPVVARDLPVLREVFGASVAYGRDPEELATRLAEALDAGSGAAAPGVASLLGSHTWEAAAAGHVELYERLVL